MFAFNKNYFLLALLIFIVEVCIALFVHDQFVRPYLGDVLVVVLLYCCLKSFLKISVLKACIAVLLFSFTIEFMQYLNIVEILGLQGSKIARTVIGTTFSWFDLLTYLAGIGMVFIVEKSTMKRRMII